MNEEKLQSLLEQLRAFPPESTLLDREKENALAISREPLVSPFFGVAFSPYRSVGEVIFQERQAFIDRAIRAVASFLELELETAKALVTPDCLVGRIETVTTDQCITAVERVLSGETSESGIWDHVVFVGS